MNTIYKYVIEPWQTEIEMPVGAKILSVAFQSRRFCLWAKVNTSKPTEKRTFVAFGTGHAFPTETEVEYNFIGTGHMNNGMVFHAFEVI